jgi:hypothetical protein
VIFAADFEWEDMSDIGLSDLGCSMQQDTNAILEF